jgi:diazepam-binding inhibitor (GABA receptor modulating acyl-CoA-binding protein)
MEDVEKEFEKSVDHIRRKSTFTSGEDLLILYGLYKQITEGNCVTPQPWSVQVIERARWEAWYKNRTMSREDAMRKYIEKVNDLMKS